MTNHSVVASHTKTFGSSLNNEFRFGFSRMKTKFDIPFSQPLFSDYGILGIPKTGRTTSNDHGLTRFSTQGYTDIGPRSFWPNFNNLDLFQFNDTVSKYKGAHGLKAGAGWRRGSAVQCRAAAAAHGRARARERTVGLGAS